MSLVPKLAQRAVHTGTFQGAQAQKLAQDAARKVNSHADMLAALQNRAYTALAVDSTAPLFTYATLLTANITTVLATGYLIITFTASGVQQTTLSGTFFQVLVDNVIVKGTATTAPLTWPYSAALTLRVPVTRGPHVVLVQWNTQATNSLIRPVTHVEEHANLLVQEAA